MTLYEDIQALYNRDSHLWDRNKPKSRSDFLIRPAMVDMMLHLNSKNILDLGCGEGYVTRLIANALPKSEIHGIDISDKMLSIAKRKEEKNQQGIIYHHGNMIDLSRFEDATFDTLSAALSTHYIPLKHEVNFYKEASRVLKQGGYFIIGAISLEALWNINTGSMKGYKENEGKLFKNKIERISGKKQEVWHIHKTTETLEKHMQEAGFTIIEKAKLGEPINPYNETSPIKGAPYVLYVLQKT